MSSYAERHTTGPDAARADVPGLEGLAPLPDSQSINGPDARALSKTLFARLDELEEGTPEHSYVRNCLVEYNLALVHYAVGRMNVRNESYEDVLQVGTIGLIKAIDRFQVQRGTEFPTFAMPTIFGEIKRFYRDTTWSVHVPRRLQELRIDLSRATAQLEQTHGRTPTVRELAERLHLDEDDVVEGLIAANGYTAVSLDYPNDAASPEDTLAEHFGYLDDGLEKVEDLHSLKPLIAALPERDRKILALRYAEDKTQSAIGRELGISQMHVSRILKRLLNRLGAQLTAQH
ncbi:SigB/SigF/SigG family RNA polymerase sigma factor [Streptomyces sp. YC537]|uniref:SigB/SigF/SigG family RNA polymerase sigma factor n=2 Tax=Streptomyces boluensis TaxID=1775135 RepID=A0A964XJ64_9ACTN|nr:SigB/SigF/SigG family RNA polymerase sigma factor [Streptomyces boluensis]